MILELAITRFAPDAPGSCDTQGAARFDNVSFTYSRCRFFNYFRAQFYALKGETIGV